MWDKEVRKIFLEYSKLQQVIVMNPPVTEEDVIEYYQGYQAWGEAGKIWMSNVATSSNCESASW